MSNSLFFLLLSLLVFQSFQTLTTFTVPDSAHWKPGLAPNPFPAHSWTVTELRSGGFLFLNLIKNSPASGPLHVLFLSGNLFPYILNCPVPHFILGACSENSLLWEASSDRVSRTVPLPIALAVAGRWRSAHLFILLLSAPLEDRLFQRENLTPLFMSDSLQQCLAQRDSEINTCSVDKCWKPLDLGKPFI